jgi:hypothetical protein
LNLFLNLNRDANLVFNRLHRLDGNLNLVLNFLFAPDRNTNLIFLRGLFDDGNANCEVDRFGALLRNQYRIVRHESEPQDVALEPAQTGVSRLTRIPKHVQTAINRMSI